MLNCICKEAMIMNSWQEIQKTIEYIEEHFDEEIDIDKLAAIAHLSKYYYQRLFYRLINKTVKEYVKLRRLAKASKLLKETDLRILDIAIKCGFSNHGNFSKVFKEVYHISPDRYRKMDIHLDHFIKPDIALNYILIDTGVPLIVDKMVLEINEEAIESDKYFIGKSKLALIKDLNQPKINNFLDLWQNLKLNKDQIGVDILTLCDFRIDFPRNSCFYSNPAFGILFRKKLSILTDQLYLTGLRIRKKPFHINLSFC